MATVSLSPTPAPIAAMSSRRIPLTNNPNAANSPLRGSSTLAAFAKQKRSYATTQREEAYGQPPPMKKQALENGSHRLVRSPSKLPRSQLAVRSNATQPQARDRVVRPTATSRSVQDADAEKEVWKKHHMARFPKMVFYFESIPDDVRAKLIKRVTYLGARQEPFFSIDVTHVVTTRSIPRDKPDHEAETEHEQDQEAQEQPQTINPSLLDRNTSEARRKLLFEFRQTPLPSQPQDDLVKRNKASRNNDVLLKAREMGKKIWPLEKFQHMLSVLLEVDTQRGQGVRQATSRNQYGASRGHEANLLQLLQHERLNGPTDRDPTAVNRELNYFKGPYIYVWDMDEKQKPIMARDYPKVVNKAEGEWPQFRSVGNGRCPFVPEMDVPERNYRKAKEQREKAKTTKKDDSVTILRPPENPLPKPVTGKRTLTEMEDGHNKARGMGTAESFNAARVTISKANELRQNAFISRAEGGRVLGGEPVASGIQASNITSAIRSQMISSTSGIHGAKAGTSKEVHGLQRKVLQKAAPGSHDHSSRRLADVSMDVASSRSTTMGRPNSKLATMREDSQEREKKPQPKSKKDMKPGYCENCQDKFQDFDEHILSRKHRRFAEDAENWTDLDALLSQLTRVPKYAAMDSDTE